MTPSAGHSWDHSRRRQWGFFWERTHACQPSVQFSHSVVSEQASFNFMTAVTICSDFGAQENKVSHCFHCFPIYLP